MSVVQGGGQKAGGRKRVPALDGLRGLAVAAVITYHLNSSWMPGGYLGVDIFFVISGFLISGILLDALSPGRKAWPVLKEFWVRRARRLVPALIVLLAVVALAAAIVAPDAVPRLRADIPAALGFVENWRLLLHHDSYFQLMGRPPLLQHLWSLGVEEQFYLVWPWVVLLVARKAACPPRALCALAVAGAIGSAVLMGALYVPGHDGSSVYYNTFTHASGLMLGSAAAGFVRGYGSTFARWSPRGRAWAGAGTLLGVGLLAALLADTDTFTYRGGIFLASVLTTGAVLITLRPGPLTQVLSLRPLRYLGARSYSLYLWHWPIICMTRPDVDVPWSGWQLLAFRVALIMAASELSFRLVEQPFRTGHAQLFLASLRPRGRRLALGSAGVCGVVVIALVAATNPPPLSPALALGHTSAALAPLPPLHSSGPGTTTSLPGQSSAGNGGTSAQESTSTPVTAPATASRTSANTHPTTAGASSTATGTSAAGHSPTGAGAGGHGSSLGDRDHASGHHTLGPGKGTDRGARPGQGGQASVPSSEPSGARTTAVTQAPTVATGSPATSPSTTQAVTGTSVRGGSAPGGRQPLVATHTPTEATTTTNWADGPEGQGNTGSTTSSTGPSAAPTSTAPTGQVSPSTTRWPPGAASATDPTSTTPGSNATTTVVPPTTTTMAAATTTTRAANATTTTSSPVTTTATTPVTTTTAAGTRSPVGAGGHSAPGTSAAHRQHHDVLAIGDSVLLAASTALEQRLQGDVTVDAVVGRQVWAGIDRLQQYRQAGDLVGLRAVVIDLGTNGPMTPQDVAEIRQLCKGVPLLVFVNVRVPLPWQAETNGSLAAVAHQPGIKVVNWFAASAARGVLWPDAVHPDPKGQVLYAKLVAKALGM